jgi:hypothetical protein
MRLRTAKDDFYEVRPRKDHCGVDPWVGDLSKMAHIPLLEYDTYRRAYHQDRKGNALTTMLSLL